MWRFVDGGNAQVGALMGRMYGCRFMEGETLEWGFLGALRW